MTDWLKKTDFHGKKLKYILHYCYFHFIGLHFYLEDDEEEKQNSDTCS